MRKQLCPFLFVLLLPLLLVWGSANSKAGPLTQDQAAPIRLRTVTFVPGAGEMPALAPELTINGYASDQAGYYIVQFQGPVQQAWKEHLTALGGVLLDYLPEFAFKVRMTPDQASQVAELENVAWVGLFQPAYKLSPDLVRDGRHLYTVRIERGINVRPVAAAVGAVGTQLLDQQGDTLLVVANSAQIEAIARVTDVAWIDNFVLKEKHNEYGAGVVLGANTSNSNGYDGSTQTVTVADTGLGDGTAAGAHPDIPASRIVAIYNWPGSAGGCFTAITDDGPQDVDSGHGTHVSGSVLGDGGASGEGKGTAPAANLVFQATENWATVSFFCQIFGGLPSAGYFLTGLPADLHDLYQQAYDAGARIHSNSWGAAVDGDYTADSAATDDFIWDNPDMTITFSAGNDGEDANNNGVVDNDSIGSPATAKNVITIGASEGDRDGNYQCDTNLTYTSHDAYQEGETCNSMGGNNILGTAGERWGFTTEPLNSDVTAGNSEQMAPFSSRGPTDDNRIKPDVVAPGTWILSGYSGLYQEGYGDPVNPQNNVHQWDGWGMPLNEFYKYMGGTSMSNPIAAGAAAVVRDFYQKAHSHSASAALVKATLINSAEDLLDENNDGANDNDFPIPNNHEGWGRVNVANATDGSHQFVDEAGGLNTDSTTTYQFELASSGNPFKVTLVWSDFPSTETASVNLVNNLNLVVTAPGGAVYRGNVFSSGWSQTGGSADGANNVENVYVQSAAAGTWTVEISGANVPNGPQPYALVVDGSFGEAPTPTNTPVPPTATNTPVPPTATNTPTDTPVGSTATNTPTPTDTPVPPTATNTPTPTATSSSATMHVGDLDGTGISRGSFWSAEVTITVHDSGENRVANATVSGSWSTGFGGSTSCTTNSNGQCTVSRSFVSNGASSVTFTVNNVTHDSLTYQSGDNHDPDGDSNGTSITVARP